MKEWEEAIKEKLTGYKSTLPEGDLDEFLSLLVGAGKVRPARKSALLWAVPATIAAALAVFLILPKNDVTKEAPSGKNPLPADVIAEVVDTIDSSALDIASRQVEEAITTRTYHVTAQRSGGTIPTDNNEADDSGEPEASTEECITPDNEDNAPRESAEEDFLTKKQPSDSVSYMPSLADSDQKRLKIGPMAGIAAGGGLVAAVIPFVKGAATGAPPSGYFSESEHGLAYENIPSSDVETDPMHTGPGNSTKNEYNYHFPLRVGLSVGVPVAERLRVTTGLEYKMYRTNILNSVGNESQYAHYLGIPLRLDWVFLSGKRFDVYIGAGLEGEYCIAATLGGESIKGDRPSLSLLAASGVQYNFTRRVGLYLEPELSYMLTPESQVLKSYRSNNPLMFSVATGIRINLGNNEY